MQADEWVVLLEPGAPHDESGLLYLEAVLRQEGIETMFDPNRPGEWVSAGYGGLRQVRLLVMQRDLEAARRILADLDATRPSDGEEDAGDEEESESDEADKWFGSDAGVEQPALDVDPRLATFKPPMDTAVNPGCATFLLPTIIALGALILC